VQCQSVGASMNLTEGCPSKDQSCQVSCKDPTASNQCVVLQTQLIDGSPCGMLYLRRMYLYCTFFSGFGGTCIGGHCQSADALDTAKVFSKLSNQTIN
jgi:hypothetical protein